MKTKNTPCRKLKVKISRKEIFQITLLMLLAISLICLEYGMNRTGRIIQAKMSNQSQMPVVEDNYDDQIQF